MLDSQQLINGVAVLITFFVGYKYGLRMGRDKDPAKVEKQKEATVGRLFHSTGDYKMILVVRNDLKMGKGKIAAQCGHAAVGAYERASECAPQSLRRWNESGCAKIAVKVESERELMEMQRKASGLAINTYLVRDAGRTQIEPNTKTVLAIGPDVNSKIDLVTSHLRLL